MPELDICIVPDPATQGKAREAGRRLAGLGVQSTVYDPSLIPHVSLYQLPCPTTNYAGLKAEARRVAERTAPFRVETEGYEVRSSGFVWWKVKKSAELEQLHRKVLSFLNPLRDGLLLPGIKPDFSGHTAGRSFNPEEMKAVREYGTPHALDLFKPHITLGRLVDREDGKKRADVLAALEGEAEFYANALCIGNFTAEGAVTEIREELPFTS